MDDTKYSENTYVRVQEQDTEVQYCCQELGRDQPKRVQLSAQAHCPNKLEAELQNQNAWEGVAALTSTAGVLLLIRDL